MPHIGHQMLLRIQHEPFAVHVTVEMDGQLWDAGDGSVDLHERELVRRAAQPVPR